MAVALSDLILAIRQRADMPTPALVSDAELTTYINSSVGELHGIIIKKNPSFNATSYPFTIAPGSYTYALPVDHSTVVGLDRYINGAADPLRKYAVHQFNFNQRNEFSQVATYGLIGIPVVRWQVVGTNLVIKPEQAAAGDYQLWYGPRCPALVNPSDTIEDFATINSWHEFVVVDGMIKAIMKRNLDDTSALMAIKMELKARIQDECASRSSGEPLQIGNAGDRSFTYGRGFRW